MEYDVFCSLCGIALRSGEMAYGLTGGCIDDECEGFRMNFDEEWDIYCPNCMNAIDKIINDYKRIKNQ